MDENRNVCKVTSQLFLSLSMDIYQQRMSHNTDESVLTLNLGDSENRKGTDECDLVILKMYLSGETQNKRLICIQI